MTTQAHSGEAQALDESAWVYLSLWDRDEGRSRGLRRQVVEACESSGWPAVSWSPAPRKGRAIDSSRFFDGMSHAVEHADVVIVLINRRSAMTDAELAFAYSHNRPVVGLCLPEDETTRTSEVQAMLQRYARARIIERVSVDACVSGLREVLADPAFAATIREAARERWDGV